MSDLLDLRADPHRRLNALTGEWVLVSPQRTERPWQGQIEPQQSAAQIPEYDPDCYMCPRNRRANGEHNPDYKTTFVFDNDFPALRPDTRAAASHHHELLVAAGAPGMCRVVCFSPRHDVTIAMMTAAEIKHVVDVWAEEAATMARTEGIQYVQVFENRGAMMGASNPHPHGQIWATQHLPNEILKEHTRQQHYFAARGSDLLGDYLAFEVSAGERLIYSNDHFVALVPFWAIWPFETMVVARRPVGTLEALSSPERDGLADVLKQLFVRYDNLFGVPCPYSMGFHIQPNLPDDMRHWRLHAHVYPPLLRSATVRKFMVGYEMLATPQRDLTPEAAAAKLVSGLIDS
jgi:UDPglucose--hexose-1-phosphate uridylyltransferase